MSFEKLNDLGRQKKPFLFISDFKAKNLIVIPLDELVDSDIEFKIDENYIKKNHTHKLKINPIPYDEYKTKFDKVIEEIKSGNTYLLNLTTQTKIKSKLDLKAIYKIVNAPYKIRYKNDFVSYSPEKFISIYDNKIHTFPMKGTIDASIDDAKNKILNNKKEMAEHVMVVDLLRNDLNMVSCNVKVKKFRYIKKIDAGQKKLLQVSSHICGDLQENWHENIGNILQKLLPAGSISGTPKKSTLDIIGDVENYNREFYSGIFGVYDGERLDSGVMIRFIQNTKTSLVYKSGGGITIDSNPQKEYKEMIDKIYLP